MKNALKLVLVALLTLSAGVVSAQHRGGYSGQRGHNSVQHNGGHNNGWQYSGYNRGYRHGGYGWVAPLFIGAGVTYLVTRPYYVEPPVVYYESLPRVVPAPQQRNDCHRETRKIFDEKGTLLGEQILLVCPVVTTVTQ